MAYPTVALKVSLTTDRFDTPSYTTLPASDIQGFDVEHGRRSELDGSDPGTLDVDLYSDTRTYDPNNASSTYSPNLLPGKKTQLTATYNGVTYELFNGWTTAWPQKYGLRTGIATLKATGPFAILQRTTVPDAYQATVLADSPTGYYRLGSDAAAHTITDSSGNNRHGHWFPDYYDIETSDGLIASDDEAVKLKGFPAVQIGKIPSTVIPALRPLSIEFWIQMDKVPRTLAEGLYLGNEVFSTVLGPNGGPNIRVYSEDGAYPGALDFLIVDSSNPASWHIAEATNVATLTGGWSWGPLQANGKVHLVFTINSAGNDMFIWFDANDATSSLAFTGTVSAVAPWSNLLDINWAAGWDGDCVIDELAFYSVELSSTQVYDHWVAGAIPGLDDLPGERIGRILDLIDWPASLRDLDTGQTVLGIDRSAGEKALKALDVVTASEQGLLSEAHDDTGKLRFQSRAARLTDTRSSTVQVLFSDQASDIAGAAVVYSDIGLATDDRPAGNAVTIKWAGTDVKAVDQSSIDAYGEIPLSVETILESHDEAVSLADLILTEQSTKFTRIRSITLRPSAQSGTMADRSWAAALGTKVGDRIRVVHQPASTGTAIDQHLTVIGVEHHAADGVETWETVLHLAPAITTTYWILGTGQLGSSTVLFY